MARSLASCRIWDYFNDKDTNGLLPAHVYFNRKGHHSRMRDELFFCLLLVFAIGYFASTMGLYSDVKRQSARKLRHVPVHRSALVIEDRQVNLQQQLQQALGDHA